MRPETAMPTKNPEQEPVCAMCGVPAKQRCAGCRAIFYCGREHQKAHWKEHSGKCKCYKLVENARLGRHYVASRAIEAGEIVIREEQPLVQGPQQETLPVCLGCSTPLQPDKAKPCEQCGWPLCAACVKHGPECDFTKRYRESKVSISGFGIPHPTYKCITIIRALCLRDSNPEAYKRFTNLSSGSNEIDFREPRDIAKFIKRFFNKLTDISEDEIARVAGILQSNFNISNYKFLKRTAVEWSTRRQSFNKINGHEVPITEPSQLAVYDISSYVEHSCKANCSKSFTDLGGLVIRAATKIEKGDHITICYTDPLWGTANRRHHLLRTKFFECTCPRCSDPTEFGTMFNAIRCTKPECPGYMLPKTFATAEVLDYKCGKCENAVSGNAADEMMELVGKDLATMKKNDVDACRTFVKKYAGKVVHENHYYVTDVKLALAQLIGQQEGGLPRLDTDVISEKILLCKRLNDLLKTLTPAENRVRGLVLFEMHAAVAEFGRRQDKDQLYSILQESKKMLNESYQLLKCEPEILPEGKIARTAKRNLREMEMIITRLCQNTVAPL